MKDRTLMLAGLIEEDDYELARQAIVESYEEQFEDDRKNISENVSFIEEDELRLIRLLGEQEKEPEWEGGKKLNENIALGGLGPGFVGSPNYALSSHYSPSQSEIMGQIVGGGYHRDSEWKDLNNPKIKLFQKIAESNPGAFGMPTIQEEELPEFDDNFNPILSEMGQSPKEHYKSVMDQFRGGPAIDPEDYPEINGLEGPFNMKGRILYYDPREGKYYDRKIDMYVDDDELSHLMEGEFAVQGGIGPGFEAYDGIKKEVVNPYKSVDQSMSRWYLGEMKEQPDRPGEIDYFEDGNEDDASRLSPPDIIRVNNVTLTYVGKDRYEEDFHLYEDDVGEIFGLAKDVDGWYAAARGDWGTIAEGFGDTPEEAMKQAVIEFYGEELSESLLETVEGTDGNAWHYRRTGTPGGYNVRYREDGKPTMHPEAPEEPSSEGHPGLTGWHFYDGDHTQQKMKAQMEDILDDGETKATEEVLMKFFKKYSVYED